MFFFCFSSLFFFLFYYLFSFLFFLSSFFFPFIYVFFYFIFSSFLFIFFFRFSFYCYLFLYLRTRSINLLAFVGHWVLYLYIQPFISYPFYSIKEILHISIIKITILLCIIFSPFFCLKLYTPICIKYDPPAIEQ